MARFRPLAHEDSDTDHGLPAYVLQGSESTKVNDMPVARIGDLLNLHLHFTPPFVHIAELIVTGSAKTFDEGLPVARATGFDEEEGEDIDGDLCSYGAEITVGSVDTFANE